MHFMKNLYISFKLSLPFLRDACAPFNHRSDKNLAAQNAIPERGQRAGAYKIIRLAHSDRRAEKTAEAAKYDAFGPNNGGAFRPFETAARRLGRLRPARGRRRSPPLAHW